MVRIEREEAFRKKKKHELRNSKQNCCDKQTFESFDFLPFFLSFNCACVYIFLFAHSLLHVTVALISLFLWSLKLSQIHCKSKEVHAGRF